MSVVTVENLKKVYMEHFMLDKITFQVQAGALCAVIGDDISGRRQLLETIAGLTYADSGSVKRTGMFRYVPGGIIAYENVTAQELFRHTMRLYDVRETEEYEALCDRFQIDVHQKLLNMTYMENRCVALVNALISEPDLLLLDEPYNYLSDEVYTQFLDVIQQKCKDGMTVLLSCESFKDVRNYATAYLYLKEGDIIQSGQIAADFRPWKMVTVFEYQPGTFEKLQLEWVAREKDRLCFIYKEDSKKLLSLLMQADCSDFLVEELTFEEQLFKNYERWKK